MEATISIEGLTEYSRALRKLDSNLPKMVRVALNAGALVVVEYGTARMPRKSGRAVGTIKARSTRAMVRVSEGSSRAPYVPWLDFGGRTGRRKRTVRDYITGGRYLYPALSEKRGEIDAALEGALLDTVREAGLEVD